MTLAELMPLVFSYFGLGKPLKSGALVLASAIKLL